jgi:phosphate transport system ATP-binding protein
MTHPAKGYSQEFPPPPCAGPEAAVPQSARKIEVQNLRLSYGPKEVIHGISFHIYRNEILGVIGPAQSGKTSLLRCINRTIDFTADARVSGTIKVDGQDVRAPGAANGGFANVFELRRKIGMVAPLPVGLPISIYDNVAFAPRCAGMTRKGELDAIVEQCIRQAALWDEVKDRLDSLGTKLSGGQQQRLTIARALSHQPEILCLDEFSIAIDPVTTMRIEDVLKELKKEMTIILVTNLVQQARRLAARTMFLWNGEIIEIDTNEVMFSDKPRDRRTYEYVNGIFG